MEKNGLKILIAGGGTGGHVFPALAVASEFKKRGCEVVFVGTKRGLEAELVHKMGWKIEFLSAPKWKGMRPLKKVVALFHVPLAVVAAWKIISRNSPDIVVGVGGYISAPAIIAAVLRNIPTLIMEQNSIPGFANRLTGRFAKKVCITFPSSGSYFKSEKVVLTGNPVRTEIKDVRDELPAFDNEFVLLCFGGSQGAKSINEAIFASLRFLRNRRNGIKIYHQVGLNADVEIARDIYEKEGFNAKVYRFIDDIAELYSRAHLVICRAGATSVSELMVVARPAVLVPYPHAADNHQEKNARYVAENGGAVMVLDRDLSGEKIAEIIMEHMHYTQKLIDMNEAMKKMAKRNAAEQIADECFKLCN